MTALLILGAYLAGWGIVGCFVGAWVHGDTKRFFFQLYGWEGERGVRRAREDAGVIFPISAGIGVMVGALWPVALPFLPLLKKAWKASE